MSNDLILARTAKTLVCIPAIIPPKPMALPEVPRSTTRREWRPDLWPAIVWAPALMVPGLIGAIVVLILLRVFGVFA